MAATHSCRSEPQRESERALDFSFGKQPKTCSAERRDEELRTRCQPKKSSRKKTKKKKSKQEEAEEEGEEVDFPEN